ncbi:hypothetical protein P4133_33200 [Pseudomonas aeruginosa]|nr:hypothetical protein [Pseudomonas aeruginosa]
MIADTEFLNHALALLCSRLREASGFVERVCLHRLESRLARISWPAWRANNPRSLRDATDQPEHPSSDAQRQPAEAQRATANMETRRLISCRNDRILINDLGRLRRKAEPPAAPLSPR